MELRETVLKPFDSFVLRAPIHKPNSGTLKKLLCIICVRNTQCERDTRPYRLALPSDNAKLTQGSFGLCSSAGFLIITWAELLRKVVEGRRAS